MSRLIAAFLALLPLLATAAGFTTLDQSRRALSQPMPGLDEGQRERFAQGRNLFNQMWVIAPSLDAKVDGLGPLYNRLSCAACHPDNGRGRAPDGPDQKMRSMLVRLSLPGVGPHGGTNPHPTYGDQLNEQGIPGVPGEGQAEVSYTDLPVLLGDGTTVILRQPHLTLKSPGYGPFDGILISPRIGPALTGMGLLEAVPETEILAWADPDDTNGDGISGRPNFVWDAQAQRSTLGRFGLKANVPSLRQQIAGAFVGDMGITSPLFPAENCTPAQSTCAAAPSGGKPELSTEQLDAITFYLQTLAVPERRGDDLPQVHHGEMLFHQAGCAACHRPQLHTTPNTQLAQLAGRLIAPYTDLLLHDLGALLADGRPDFQASGSEWRTAPLWGIGLAETVGDQVGYLHDGRARTLLEAILWHGGEAAPSREAVRTMGSTERTALLAFLRAL
ncbi:hypothetical protein THII_1166 [Thioploca ingrica]|uniref:Cytochrome c domain-containing protein n=1 Tax=Thioploca ingrica TaxID=40754 RepID=A0A090ACK1_9GAMM|nr:hypothetical protein THII_1166 [Thioploca ingrica]